MKSATETSLRLEPIAGPPLDPVFLRGPGPYRVGRGSDSDIVLAYGTVSRRHGLFSLREGLWHLADSGSRHGTFVNGLRLEAQDPTPIAPGDLIRMGPWTFRVRDPESRTSGVATTNDFHQSGHRIETVHRADRQEFAQHRLELLIDWAGSAHESESIEALAGRMLQMALDGTGLSRGAVVRQVSAAGDVETLAEIGHGGETGGGRLDISRSLLAAASTGEVVRLTNEVNSNYGESIMQLGIHSAVCAPLMLERSVEAYLYVDAREGERAVAEEAAAFCAAVARVGEMALGGLRRHALEALRKTTESDLRAARDAQDLIMPPAAGSFGVIRYAVSRQPGRMVAGDLFDVVPRREGGQVGVFLGDVSGKGVGAGLLMAVAQTNLRLGLRREADPGLLLTDLNEYLQARSTSHKFITLWLGLFDPVAGQVRFADAGHGHWLVVEPGSGPRMVCSEGRYPIGIDTGVKYPTESLRIAPGSRVVLFSDGLVEQTNLDGDEFGTERAMEVLRGCRSCDEDVTALHAAVIAYAGTDSLADDLTIASVEFGAG